MTDTTTQAPTRPAPLLVDEREAARLLSVCPRTVFALAARGELRPVRIGNAKRYVLSTIHEYIDRQVRSGGAA